MEVPCDGRPAEYRWCPLLNAGEIVAVVVAVVQFRNEKRRAVLSNYTRRTYMKLGSYGEKQT